MAPANYQPKRLILCCDGTWMNSDTGYEKATLFNPSGGLQIPSNVTRIARCFKQVADDGRTQVINYESGVGTGSNTLDTVVGGAFGAGVSERVREAYQFICANYADGDEIILIGFSRGAYTARSVAGMIGDLGLLTREGLEHFYPIFKDMENWNDKHYKDPFPTVPFADKPKGKDAPDEYRDKLERIKYTRVRQQGGKGDLIKVKAIGVWDTVGSLGIPQTSWMNKLGLQPSNKEFQFYDTNLSDRIEYAFQALALDETRPPFSPAVWERQPTNKDTTDLRQVWFPGNHGNVGGGWPDQGIANITLAWMMDQLASIGVEFDDNAFEGILERSSAFYERSPVREKWAVPELYEANNPFRPWALSAIQKSGSWFYFLAGKTPRSPGLYRQVDADGRIVDDAFLRDTNEKVHPCVRVRLACKGMGLDDKGVWDCQALKSWRLVKKEGSGGDGKNKGVRSNVTEVPERTWGPPAGEDGQEEVVEEEGWGWEWDGKESGAPPATRLEEETLGPYERFWLRMARGNPNVWSYASQSANVTSK